MLPKFGFHDSSVDALKYEGTTLTIQLSDLQELAPGVASWELVSAEEMASGSERWNNLSATLTFEGVREVSIDHTPADGISMETADGELDSLSEAAGVVSMIIRWWTYQPNRTVEKFYRLTCESIRYERIVENEANG